MDTGLHNKRSLIAAISFGAMALVAFLWQTHLLQVGAGPLLTYAILMFVLFPYREESAFIRRFVVLSSLVFTLWFLTELGMILLPFAIAFFVAYILDPLVSKLSSWKLNRSFVSLVVLLSIVGSLVLVSIFIFPSVFQQMNEVTHRVSSLVNSTTEYLESRQFYRWLEEFGISGSTAREIVQKEVAPQLESISQAILTALLHVLTSLSAVAQQAVNVVLIPVLSFYFLNDLPSIKSLVRGLLAERNPRVLYDLTRINMIVRAYISGQIISAVFVGTMATTIFLLLHIPYGIVLGVLCGLLNPVPFVGILASLFVAVVTILIVGDDAAATQIVEVSISIVVLHFISTYVIDPHVTGNRIGLHPVALIAALFVFGHFFGFLGLLVSVPAAAILVMYFNDWQHKRKLQQSETGAAPESVPPTAAAT